jgi:Na+-transporting NADH:ubiquinone oxidoreductase subunit C
MSVESNKKIIGIALGICIVCSIFVSTATVTLRSRQEENKKIEKIKNILLAGDLLKKGENVQEIYNRYIEGTIIKLETGEQIPKNQYTAELNLEDFDVKTISSDSRYSKTIPSNIDIAQIKRMPSYMAIYFVKEANVIQKIILPVYGKGLWSTMYGFIALGNDLRTVEGFTFYEHGETPGLGGEVDNPSWKKIWKGKKAFDENGKVKIEVIKGRVDTSSDDAQYQIDGLSGSTLTTRGIDNLIRFWLGKNGYGPFFERIKKERVNDKI